jgi:hypothetical protein
MTERIDIDLLDPDDPFEVDPVNRPHLYKHFFTRPDGRPIRIDLSDLLDLYVWRGVVFYPADLERGPAHWLMVGEIDGVIVTVPLAPARSGESSKCRPIGLYVAAAAEQDAYRRDV